jgi:hypothetical protein
LIHLRDSGNFAGEVVRSLACRALKSLNEKLGAHFYQCNHSFRTKALCIRATIRNRRISPFLRANIFKMCNTAEWSESCPRISTQAGSETKYIGPNSKCIQYQDIWKTFDPVLRTLKMVIFGLKSKFLCK